MNWIRNISLVRRVSYGFGAMAVVIAAIGGTAVWLLRAQAADIGRWSSAAGAWPSRVELQAWQTNSEWTLGVLASFSVGAVVFAALAGWLICASIKSSVGSTVDCVMRIAGGDLETKIDSPGRDEIAWLRSELNSMRKKLRGTILEVRRTVDGVTAASREIASGNDDLSSRTESQASAVQQTASSMRQLADTVSSNAASSREASGMVARSNEVAERGAQTMRDVIRHMGEINVSSAKISEIIGVIDNIAFQTNILALNAAVEAARAGDHGRGFAVVASEVRGLARRSSTAAREIKLLIGDSTDKVDAGSRLVDAAGQTMHDIVASVSQVSRLIADITLSSELQSTGIGQAHQAIDQIDDMTQRNAALVQQLAASAQSLRSQSGQLGESISSFRV